VFKVNSYTLHININYNNYAYNSLMKTHQDVMKRKLNEAEMKTILLIEDNYQILENFTEYLEMEGYNILGASNGKRGVELAMEFLPDLIICDVLMPGMDGHEVLCLRKLTGMKRWLWVLTITSSSLLIWSCF
jgi:response regulator RpfG family c-di-GMP phosphodiesterase